MSIAKEKMFTKHGTVEAKKLRVKNAPNQYYLKYVIFDILYVGKSHTVYIQSNPEKHLTSSVAP
jgi:hypothetical protein